jgi:hypothetical protein
VSAPIIVLTLFGVALTGFGVHLVSLHLHRFPLDIRRPGPLFRPSRARPPKAHSSELRRLVSVVSNAILNDRLAHAELEDVLQQLGAGADDDPHRHNRANSNQSPNPGDHQHSSRRDRTRRSRRIENTVTALEARWPDR